MSHEDVIFLFNAQHNCHYSGCCATASRVQVQERLPSTLHEAVIQHCHDGTYLINMHAIHNVALLRQTLPRQLTAPQPYLLNRTATHRQLAQGLHVSQTAKREATASKGAATRAKKAATKFSHPGHTLTPSGTSTVDSHTHLGPYTPNGGLFHATNDIT
jgi:hypothetical protein